tara:strand:+ start:5180 stop:5806 length:627 start_codon:yes stop_codon:yes gene_type:complete
MEIIMDNAKIKEAFKFLSNQELVGWDKNFVESVTEWFERHDKLSEKQYAILARIIEKFSPENLQAKEEWAIKYRDSHLKDAKIIAKYYEGTGYFTALARDILYEETFVPSRKQWKAIAENKYAQKVLTTYYQDPAYAIGDMVSFRQTDEIKRFMRRNDIPFNGAVVLEYLDEVVSHAKGAKRLTVLPVGSNEPVHTEERHLKKFRKKK